MLDGADRARVMRGRRWYRLAYDQTGIDLLRKLNGNKPTETVVVTGYGQVEDVKRCKEAGFDEHVTKPIDLDALELLLRGLRNESNARGTKPTPKGSGPLAKCRLREWGSL